MQDESLTMTARAFTEALQHTWQSGAASGRVEGAIVTLIAIGLAVAVSYLVRQYNRSRTHGNPDKMEI